MSLNEKFNQCAEKVRRFSKKPDDKDLLELYSLYKQATCGDCTTAKPTAMEAKAKWEAWYAKHGLDQDAARNAYIIKTNELAPKYA
ncbi:Acyl-CoA binding protein 1 [Carabus blaptoides fortunei]